MRGERGSATVLMAAAAAVLLAGLAVVAVFATYVAVGHKLRAITDVVALAGARHAHQSGPDGACDRAKVAAQANGVRLATCSVEGDRADFVVTVTVAQRVQWVLGGHHDFHATAHAGRVA